ncbi:hypothetical protein Patl1_04711 [Pistacia atlantica]|uniref:Uncharacterized protein n=1 Tax=Pistacia atlantica TaxID=434234 RepID=A0ACC1BUL1_9ROSI|nr:hypothetical protein Patl1_04711 [Pistacia atlantica]
MVVLGFIPLTCFKWILFACFVYSSLGLTTQNQVCDPSDLLALENFAKSFSNGSIFTSWARDSICCQWVGVVCGDQSNVSVPSKVVMLKLARKGLKGLIPRSIAGLDQLKSLDLSFNHLEGALPVELSKLKQLEVLDLSHNNLSGPVAGVLSGLKMIRSLNVSGNSFNGDLSELGEFPNLAVFNLSNNSFTGSLNSKIWRASNGIQILDFSMNRFGGKLEGLENCSSSLKELHLDSNSLAGVLPDALYSLSSLQQLTLSENHFYGLLKDNLSKLTSLKFLIISGNQLSGRIPDVFGNLTNLEILDASSNSFSGQLPSSLALCSKLHVLDLRNNSLTGQIDLNFTGLPSLCTLELASNHFSGLLPNSLSDCRELKVLSLAKNNLTGQIPESFTKLTSLFFFSLSNNSFVDLPRTLSVLQQCKNLTIVILTKNFIGEKIPENVSGFESLMVLALGNCGLKGHIPLWLLSCKKLQVLDLSWNHLDGSIPPWIGQMENLFYLDFSNNSLTGEIPRKLAELKSLISNNCGSSNVTASIGIPLYVKRNQSANGLQYHQASSFPPSIYLSNNRINGTIPPEIGRLKQLHGLDLSRNNISGPIPRFHFRDGELGRQFYSFPASSFEGNPGLCGGVDSPCGSKDSKLKPGIPSGSNSKIGRGTIIGITFSIGIGIAILLAVALLKLSKRDEEDQIDDLDEELSRPRRLSEGRGSSRLVLFQNSDCKDLTCADLLKSTNNFNQANIIGCGGFGLVYKANLPNGTKAAIKRLSGDCGQMEREFQAEVEALSRAQHKNLVSLQGYCRHGSDRLLIYSYMENGSLDYWLHDFGVVLLELLTGRRPVEVCKGKNCRDLVSWVFQMKSEKRESEIIDPSIWDKDREKQLLDMLEIACKCLDRDPKQRPLIEEVVSSLRGIATEPAQQ